MYMLGDALKVRTGLMWLFYLATLMIPVCCHVIPCVVTRSGMMLAGNTRWVPCSWSRNGEFTQLRRGWSQATNSTIPVLCVLSNCLNYFLPEILLQVWQSKYNFSKPLGISILFVRGWSLIWRHLEKFHPFPVVKTLFRKILSYFFHCWTSTSYHHFIQIKINLFFSIFPVPILLGLLRSFKLSTCAIGSK